MEIKYPDNCTKILDKGFVRLVDVMGDDSSIVQAARVSYGQGTKSVNDDTGLIRYLLRHKHTTPFEMVEFKFHCRMPIFVARQWIRHRTASVNEMSGRYSEMPDMFYVPEVNKITTQSKNNKQGGTDEVIKDVNFYKELMETEQEQSYTNYQSYLSSGMRKEIARNNLPLSLYTEWYWKIDLHNLLHFLRLRLDSHAQYEIRVFGEAMAQMVKEKVPIAWKAFEDYSLNSVSFSALELEALKVLLNKPLAEGMSFDSFFPGKGEAAEFVAKLNKL